MRSLILCEGFDDVLILGYYLFKTKGWRFDKSGLFSKYYDFPKMNEKRQIVEVYKKEQDTVGIWTVGGKDAFEAAYKFVSHINRRFPEEGIGKVFIITDRDNTEVDSSLKIIKEKMRECGLEVDDLKNNMINTYKYEVDEEIYGLDIIPLIIPFDKNGALETVLIEGISETGEEEAYIVESAEHYISTVVQSGRLQNYLRHDRLVIKAKLSAVISVTNPDRSTALFDKILMSWPWEEKEAVRRHFENIVTYLE